MWRVSLPRDHWWGSGKCFGGHLVSFLWSHAHHDMQDTPGRSFPLKPPFFGGSRRQGLKEWMGKLRYHFKGSNKTPCGNAALCTCGRTVSVQGSEKMPDWVLKEKGGTLNPEKSEFLCLTGVLNTHTQSKRGSCAHPPSRLHHFSEHREYKTSFQKNKPTTTIKQKCRIQTFGWSVFRNRRNKS